MVHIWSAAESFAGWRGSTESESDGSGSGTKASCVMVIWVVEDFGISERTRGRTGIRNWGIVML